MAKEDLFSDEIRERERRRRRIEPLWGLLSFLFHLVFFGVVIVLTPVKDLILDKPKEKASPAADLSADRLEDIAESLSEARMNELVEQIEALQAVLHNMRVMKEELSSDYKAFVDQQQPHARELMKALVQETQAHQEKATAVQEQIATVVQKMTALETADSRQSLETSQKLKEELKKLENDLDEKVTVAQASAVNALDKLKVKANFTRYRKVAEAAEKVLEAQMEAGDMQAQAQQDALETARQVAEIAPLEQQIAEAKKVVAEQKPLLETAEKRKAELDQQSRQEQSLTQKLKQEASQLRREKKWHAADQKNQEANAHYEAWKNLNAERQSLQGAIHQKRFQIARAENVLKREEPHLAAVKEFARKNADERQNRKVAQAQKAQSEVEKRVRILYEIIEKDSPEKDVAERQKEMKDPLETAESREKQMAEAYQMAVELEQKVAEKFVEVKALETALAKKMDVEEARKLTDVPLPDRRKANEKLLAEKPRTKEVFDRKKQEEKELVQEADHMVTASVEMMESAMAIVFPKTPDAAVKGQKIKKIKLLDEKALSERREQSSLEERLAELETAAEFELQMAAAAAEDDAAKAKDIADMMKDEAEKANESSEVKVLGEGSAPSPLKGDDMALWPGNVMAVAPDSGNGIPAKWMYVQSWYVIGPFPNPNRVNLRRKFAPESKVDLDATYIGKDGRVLKWSFIQANNSNRRDPWGYRQFDAAEVIPEKREEYAIYYAYAEVFFDQPCDRWIAIGSDDRSDMWINDTPVWGSSNKLKAWRLAEDYRRVHFKKGRNRVLIRVENGHWNCGWSLCISVEDAK